MPLLARMLAAPLVIDVRPGAIADLGTLLADQRIATEGRIPPMNLVAEWSTMSAPHSIGRHRYGVANVLSTISGSSLSCAMAATVSMSSTFPAGLPIVSAKNAFVFGRTACRHASGSSGLTHVSSTFILRSKCLN